MGSQEEIFSVLSDTLVGEFGFQASELRLETHLGDDLGLDSIDAIDLIVRLEEKTGHRLSEDDLGTVRTLGDVVRILVGRLDSPPA